MTNTTHSLVFREETGFVRFTFATTTPVYRRDADVCLQIINGDDKFPVEELDRNEVEELHQFTYEILAGRHGDPRLDVVDAEIMCGAQAESPNSGHLECALPGGHRRVGDFDHVDRSGVVFDTPAGF